MFAIHLGPPSWERVRIPEGSQKLDFLPVPAGHLKQFRGPSLKNKYTGFPSVKQLFQTRHTKGTSVSRFPLLEPVPKKLAVESGKFQGRGRNHLQLLQTIHHRTALESLRTLLNVGLPVTDENHSDHMSKSLQLLCQKVSDGILLGIENQQYHTWKGKFPLKSKSKPLKRYSIKVFFSTSKITPAFKKFPI